MTAWIRHLGRDNAGLPGRICACISLQDASVCARAPTCAKGISGDLIKYFIKVSLYRTFTLGILNTDIKLIFTTFLKPNLFYRDLLVNKISTKLLPSASI